MTSSSLAVRIQDLPFNKDVQPLVIQDPLVQKLQKTMKQYPPGTASYIFKQDPNDWRCQNIWNGCKKLRQLCVSSTQYDACAAYVHTIGINMPITSPPDDAFISFWQPDQQTWHAVMFSSVHRSFSDAPAIRRCPSRRIHWIQRMNLNNLTRSSHLIKQTIPCLIQDLQLHTIDELQEITFDKYLKDDTPLTPQMHTAYRSVLGHINWLQSRTQFHIGYQFSRCASKASSPTIEDVRAINKTVRTIKSIPLSMRFWPLRGKTRIVGYPDASYRNNEDKSSQRAHGVFLAEQRDLRQGSSNSRGSLVDSETHKITATTMSTTVAELHGLMRCYGSALFLRGLWSDITGEIADVHIRTDAKNLVTTASTTHQPEQKENAFDPCVEKGKQQWTDA